MKKTMILFVMMMVVTVANAQYDFMFNNVAVSNTTTKTNVKSVSVNQLALAVGERCQLAV